MVDDIAAEVEAMISFEALGHIEQDRLIEILWISEHLVLRSCKDDGLHFQFLAPAVLTVIEQIFQQRLSRHKLEALIKTAALHSVERKMQVYGSAS